jgi:hypothetical protein
MEARVSLTNHLAEKGGEVGKEKNSMSETIQKKERSKKIVFKNTIIVLT